MDILKERAIEIIGVIGGFIATLFGGWNASMSILVGFMFIDFITGILVACVFQKSRKSETGALESRAGFKGLCRKGVMLGIVLVACGLDTVIGSSFIRDTTAIAFIINETVSIIENAGLMGIYIPPVITKAIEILKKQEEAGNDSDN